MRLFHFSDDPNIKEFVPRPVAVPSTRAPGRDWLNGPLVWAIDEWHQPMYLFPRDCPRILLWSTPQTTIEDEARFWGDSNARMIAYIETAWREQLTSAVIHRYELPRKFFEDIADAGMWVSREAVMPLSIRAIDDLSGELAALDVELRVLDTLLPLKGVWSTTLHASGIRLRNAVGWT